MQNRGTIIAVVLIVLLLVLLLGGMGMMGFGGFGMGPGMMGNFGSYWNTPAQGFPFWGGLMMLVFRGLVVGGIVLLVISLTRGSRSAAPNVTARETPSDILKARYARGEINKEQFEQMKKDLEG